LVDTIIKRLGRGAGEVLAFGIVRAQHRAGLAARLAEPGAAPLVRDRNSAAAARRRLADRDAPADAVIGEGGLLPGNAGVGDLDQPVFGVPEVGAGTVGEQVAVRVLASWVKAWPERLVNALTV
jgi:hypothetical protein